MEKNKILTPFKLCVLQNFPYIEQDFDALTNYELMCKIVEYLNKTIEQQNITSENVNNLINWFNNLDVTDEINNKLDNMVKDGTLLEILKPYLNELNNKILINSLNISKNTNDINNKVSKNESESITMNMLSQEVKESITGGSTAVVGINSIGNINIQNESISILNLDKDLENTYIVDYSEPLVSNEYNGYWYNVSNVATYQQQDGYIYKRFNLEKGKIYQYNGFDRYQARGLIVADENENIVYISNTSTSSIPSSTGSSLIFVANRENLHAYISSTIYSDIKLFRKQLPILRKIEKIYCKEDTLSNYKLITTSENIFASVDPLTAHPEYPNLVDYTGINIKIYSMNKGVNYSIKSWNWSAVSGIVLVDNNFNIIYKSSNSNIGNNKTDINYEFKANQDGFIIIHDRVNPVWTSILSVVQDNTINKLKGLKIGADGDSIINGAENNTSFVDIIANRNGMQTDKISVNGGTIATGTYQNEVPRHWICTSVNNLENDSNIIIIGGGVNDYWNNVPMGVFTTSYTDNVDSTTFYGALETLCRNLLSKFREQKIVFVTYHKIGNIYFTNNALNLTFKDYQDAIFKIMNKYSIPVIDVNGKSRFNTAIDYYKNNYTYNNDGVHPNIIGYNNFYVDIVENEINNLL